MTDVDLSEFKALSSPRKRQCPIKGAFERLPKEEHGLLYAALAEDQRIITTGAIRTWLDRRGVTVNPQSVSSHRRGTCTCADD